MRMSKKWSEQGSAYYFQFFKIPVYPALANASDLFAWRVKRSSTEVFQANFLHISIIRKCLLVRIRTASGNLRWIEQ